MTGMSGAGKSTVRVAAIGVIAGTVAVVYGWWVGVRHAEGSAVVTGAAALATVGLMAAALGLSRGSRTVTGSGVVVAGLAAPTGFAYIANFLSLICGIVLLFGGWQARRRRQRATEPYRQPPGPSE